jgi:rod shape-determining protein MreB
VWCGGGGGGGTTDIAVISLGGIVQSKNLTIAGDRLNNDIVNYFKDEFKLLIGEKTAESIKIAIGSALPFNETIEIDVRGRDLVTGLPREILVSDVDIREAMAPSIHALVEGLREVLENTPPEILADIMHRGVVLVGGGALIKGLDKLLEKKAKMPIHVAEDPITAVARGTGVILENLEKYKEILIDTQYESPPR